MNLGHRQSQTKVITDFKTQRSRGKKIICWGAHELGSAFQATSVKEFGNDLPNMWAAGSPLEVMEEVISRFINRAAKKNLGSPLHSTSLLGDEANCNKKAGLRWPDALPTVMMKMRAAVQRTVWLQTRRHHQVTAWAVMLPTPGGRITVFVQDTFSLPIPSHPKCEPPGRRTPRQPRHSSLETVYMKECWIQSSLTSG